jgi:pullulanase/glycogen debranching enzyme
MIEGVGITLAEPTATGYRLKTRGLDLCRSHTVSIRGVGRHRIDPDGVLDRFVSSKPLGCRMESGQIVFRLFAPRASRVTLVLFKKYDTSRGRNLNMIRGTDGVWEHRIPKDSPETAYGYRIDGPHDDTELFDSSAMIADPYSPAVATQNDYRHEARSLILYSSYEWEGDKPVNRRPEDLIIYEMHVRDMTVHPSSGVTDSLRGTYLGLTEDGRSGGLAHLKALGVNAVELLPVQEFANIEVDYRKPGLPVFNDWNPYERNHWGYMTSYFFAPESYYATGASLDADGWCGGDGRAVGEFKDMVKALHRAGLSVILDVVYNHVSQYDRNPFKLIDKKYYFRLDQDQRFLTTSGCGNDFKTERPMARRVIVESLLHWMREYHVDGFRFDLAAMIDETTLDEISLRTREENPNVILIAEPWGGGQYDLRRFSKRSWGAWNDWFRNGVKGANPQNALGFIFGVRGGPGPDAVRMFIRGTTLEDGGPFLSACHSVNYLESHDDYTFGDFVRIGTGKVDESAAIKNPVSHFRLTKKEAAIHKLGALFLLTSQGMVMLHEGQEFARSKVIAKTASPDPNVGKIDHNSYNKDNETNWIDYSQANVNRDLVDYYRGLIALRNRFPAFRRAPRDRISFLETKNESGVGYVVDEGPSAGEELAVFMNANPSKKAVFKLPPGDWSLLADADKAGILPIRKGIKNSVSVPPTSGMVLMRAK